MNNTMIKRILTVIIVAFVGLIGWQTYSIFSLTSDTQTSVLSGPVLRSAFYPSLNQNGVLQYYNGDAFVSYDMKSGSKKQLGPMRGITNVIKVDWVTNGVVFSLSDIPTWHPLYEMYRDYVARHDGDNSQNSYETDDNIVNYHWYMSFKTNDVTLMNVGVDNALLFSTGTEDGGLFYREAPAYSILKADGKIAKSVSPLPKEENERRVIKATDSSYTYVAAKGEGIALYTHDIAANKSTELIGSLYASTGRSIYDQIAIVGNTLYYLEPIGEESESSVHTHNIETGETKQIIDRFQGVIRQVTPTEVTAVHIGNEYTKLYVLSDMARTVTIQNSYVRPQAVHISKNDTYVSTNKGYLYKVGGSQAEKQEPVALETKLKDNDNFALTRNIESKNDNSYTVTFVSGSLDSLMKEVYDAVADAGYDPLDFSFAANPGPRVSY